MLFKINPSRNEAVYVQIMNEVKRRMARGALKAGDRLPSVRGLARTLVINPNTAAKAYQLLETEGVIVTRRGSGTFVTDVSPKLAPGVRGERLNELADKLFTEAYHMGLDEKALMELVRNRGRSFQLPANRRRNR